MNVTVTESDAFLRLDLFLVQHTGWTRQRIQAAIKKGRCTVNGKSKKASYLVTTDDCVYIDLSQESIGVQPSVQQCDILHEDDHLLVIYKPVGLVVHSDQKQLYTVVQSLQDQGVALHPYPDDRPGIVHRLDKMTEGLMVVAKSESAYDSLKEQFQSRTIIKKYYAVVKGDINQDQLICDKPLARHPSKRHLFRVDFSGKNAYTEVTVLKRYNTKTLCDVVIKTGRTHQIRVHLSDIGHPIIGDREYGFSKANTGQLLQAYYLSFYHPVVKQHFSFEIPLSSRLK